MLKEFYIEKKLIITPHNVRGTRYACVYGPCIGAGLYDFLKLPECDFMMYVVVLEYTSWQDAKHTRLNCIIPASSISHGRTERQSATHL
jgi:hypothetical protein